MAGAEDILGGVNPVKTVEDIVGGVEEWPTYILLHLIVDDPDGRVMQNVAAFLYGNDVSVEKAVDLYIACRGRQYAPRIREALWSWYKTWDGQPRGSQFAWYYNTKVKRVLWLNGRERCQVELVRPVVCIPEIGIQGAKNIGPVWWKELDKAIGLVRLKGAFEKKQL